MILKTKIRQWFADVHVAMLSRETATKIGLQAQEMVLIKTMSQHPKETTAILNTIEGELKKDEILFSSEVVEKLNLKKGQKVDINLAPVPRSVDLIKKKLSGKKLSQIELSIALTRMVALEFEKLARLKKIIGKSRLSEEDVKEFSERVDAALSERFKKSLKAQ